MYNKSKIVLAMAMMAGDHFAAYAADAPSGLEAAVNAAAAPTVTLADATPPVAPIIVPPSPPVIGALPATNDDLIAQLQGYDRALLRNPDDVDARAGRLLTLSRLGATDLAIDEAERLPNVPAPVIASLYEDKAALQVRWSENAYYDKPGQEYPGYDQAITIAQDTLQRFPDSTRSRFYLVRALNDRKRRAEASQTYEALQADGIAMPAEVHTSGGAAYLAQKKPEPAEQAFRHALDLQPDNFNANIGLFYALVDQSRYAEARAHIDQLAAQPLPPEQKFSAATIAAMERAFEGDLATAQARLTALQEEAPGSDQIHLALGKIYLWRGWPQRARAQYELVAMRDPDNLQAGTALTEVDATLGNNEAANLRLAQLQAAVPGDNDVQKLSRDQAIRNAPELTVSMIGTRSSENLASGRGVIVESKLLGSTLWPQTRPFIHEYFERGITENVRADYRRLGAGLQYTLPGRGTVEAEVQQEFFKNRQTSGMLGGDIPLNDQWSVRGRVDSNAIDVPLVARYYGIDGWLAGAGLTYRDSERWQVSADLSQLEMSDDNTRRSYLLRGGLTVMQTPSYRGRLELEVYHATNSLGNTVVYYNPSSSDTQMLSYVSDWNNYQRYDRQFGQRLTLSLGRQSERGFSSSTIGGASYEHRASISDALSLNYGFGYIRRIYSGNISSGPEVHLSLNWKFL